MFCAIELYELTLLLTIQKNICQCLAGCKCQVDEWAMMDMLRVLNLSAASEEEILMCEYICTDLLTQFITTLMELFHNAVCHLLMAFSPALFPIHCICPPHTHLKLENFPFNDELLMCHAESDLLFELWKDKTDPGCREECLWLAISAVNNQWSIPIMFASRTYWQHLAEGHETLT